MAAILLEMTQGMRDVLLDDYASVPMISSVLQEPRIVRENRLLFWVDDTDGKDSKELNRGMALLLYGITCGNSYEGFSYEDYCAHMIDDDGRAVFAGSLPSPFLTPENWPERRQEVYDV